LLEDTVEYKHKVLKGKEEESDYGIALAHSLKLPQTIIDVFSYNPYRKL